MRQITVMYYIDDAEMIRGEKLHSEEYETEMVEASSSQEAIDLIIEYLKEQIIQNSDFSPEQNGDEINVMDGDEIVERYYNFSVKSPVKELREELGMSQAATARLFEMPVRTLQDWESGKRTPPHWVEKLVLEKLEAM